MNEAWTDITSEVMCGRKYEWLIVNLYFIVVHLLSSLVATPTNTPTQLIICLYQIFLNFFGAVILDNLEYDEEEKRQKLEVS